MTVTLILSLRGRHRDPLPQRARRKTLTTTRSQSAEGAHGVCGRTWWRALLTRRSAGGWRLCPRLGSFGGVSLRLFGSLALKAGRAEASTCQKGQRERVIRHPRNASPSQCYFEANPKCHIIFNVKYFRVYPEGEKQS